MTCDCKGHPLKCYKHPINCGCDDDKLLHQKKNEAVNACTDIYMNIHVSEIDKQTACIREAWKIGQQFYTKDFAG